MHSILKEFREQAIPGLFPHESMMFQNGLCHMIGGTPLHTYTSKVDFERARQHLARFRIAWFEQFNKSCDAMLRGLGVPVVMNDRTNPNGAGYPPSHLDHAENFGAPDEIVELVRSMNQEDIRLYRAAIELQGRTRQDVPKAGA